MRRMMTLLALVALVAACTGTTGSPASAPAIAPSSAPPTTTVPRCTVTTQTTLQRINLKVRGKSRYALVHMPAHWDGKTAVPVVLSFHGLGSTAEQQKAVDGFTARSDKDDFIVVHPQAGGTLASFGAAWDLTGTSDVAFAKAILDDLERRACVDTSRVYATGLSYGGAMTDLLSCEMSDRIAAAAPVSAYLPKRPCTPSRPVPMMSFHGVEDHLLPYKGGGRSRQEPFEPWGAAWAKRNGCAAAATVKRYKSTVDELSYSGCKAPVVLYRVRHNGHTWPGHPLGFDRQALVNIFSGKTTGKPFPLMVALGLTPEDFADTISLANQDIDASAMIWSFFAKHRLVNAP